MPPTSTEQLATVRRWVGSHPDDTEILVALAVNDDPLRVALQILHVRLADMVANPLKWATVDDYSEDRSGNLAALRGQIAALEAEVDGVTAADDYGWSSTPICGPSLAR